MVVIALSQFNHLVILKQFYSVRLISNPPLQVHLEDL